jgi:hypothetical protein
MYTKLWFGCHRGKTLAQIAFQDPDWLFWARENGCFDCDPLYDEAEWIALCARSIRLPAGAAGKVAMYTVDPSGRFAGFELEDAHIRPDGGSPVYLFRHIDLSVPRQLHGYDKGGGKILIREVKACLFGDPAFRMTEARAIAFFQDKSNFCLADDCPACLRALGARANQTVRSSF